MKNATQMLFSKPQRKRQIERHIGKIVFQIEAKTLLFG
jgi:hypothetical protein